MHLDLRDSQHRLGAESCQFNKARTVEAGQHAIPHGSDRGAADTAGEQGHLADGFAAADLAHGAFHSLRRARGAESSAQHDIHGVGRFAFAAKNVARPHLEPADAGDEGLPRGGVHAAEFLQQDLTQQGFAGLPHLGGLLRLVHHRINQVARPRKSPMLTTSVAVVRKMLEAVAGSAPNLRRTVGTITPQAPLTIQAPIMARKTMPPSL